MTKIKMNGLIVLAVTTRLYLMNSQIICTLTSEMNISFHIMH